MEKRCDILQAPAFPGAQIGTAGTASGSCNKEFILRGYVLAAASGVNGFPGENGQALRESIIAYAREHLGRDLEARDERQEFDVHGWQGLGSLGIPGLFVPPCYGGRGASFFDTAQALAALGYGCADNGLIFAMNAHMWACAAAVLHFGNEPQKRKWLPGLCRGERIGAHAASERQAGSDISAIATTARFEGGRYLLNGRKIFVTNGPLADLLVVLAVLEGDPRAAGLTAFLVEKTSPGFSVERTVSKMGLRTAQMGEILLRDCEIPAENLLGDPGGGMAVFNRTMELERIFILAASIGSMERLVERCVRFARGRSQFGRRIGSYQMISSRIVDMKLRLETARALLDRAARLKDENRSAFLEAALVKLHLSESWVACCMDALQIHGGSGYLTETGIERELRDAMGSRFYSGTSEIQKVIIAGMLGVE
jgi:alkylation response protein AidB-like acyl-CoA dehydrogenase